MKNLFLISEEEKNRILNLHINATQQQYLKEQTTETNQQQTEFLITKNDRSYDYKKVGNKIYFKGKEGTTDKKAQKYKDWTEPTIKSAIDAINLLFTNKPTGDTLTQITTNTTDNLNSTPDKSTSSEVKPENKQNVPTGEENKQNVSTGEENKQVAFSSKPVTDDEFQVT